MTPASHSSATPTKFANLSLADVMTRYPRTVSVFLKHRMLCVGCPIGPFHSISEACAIYDLDEAAFYLELVDALGSDDGG